MTTHDWVRRKFERSPRAAMDAAEAEFFARPLHSKCEVFDSLFYPGRRCSACDYDDRVHDRGDEDRSGYDEFARIRGRELRVSR